MITLLLCYALGALITWNLLTVWFHSNLPQHLWAFLTGEKTVYTKEELAIASLRWGRYGDLWVCPLCIGTWIAALVAGLCAAAWALAGLSGVFALAGVFGWPVLAYRLARLSPPPDRAPAPATALPGAAKAAPPALDADEQRIVKAFQQTVGGKPSKLWERLFALVHVSETAGLPPAAKSIIEEHRAAVVKLEPRQRSAAIRATMKRLVAIPELNLPAE